MCAMVGVASYISSSAAGDLAGDLAECIPNRRGASIIVHSSLNLVCGSCKAPEEIGGKSGLLGGSHGEMNVNQGNSWNSCVPTKLS